MDLYGHRFTAFLIQHLVTVNDGDGDDRALGFQRAFKAAAVEIQHFIPFFASGTFGEDQIVPSVLDFFGNIHNYFHGLADILAIHGE